MELAEWELKIESPDPNGHSLFGLSLANGRRGRTVVDAVAVGSMAQAMGVRAGDVVVSVNEENVCGWGRDGTGVLLESAGIPVRLVLASASPPASAIASATASDKTSATASVPAASNASLPAAVVGTTGYGLGMGVLSLFFRSLPEGRVPLVMRWEVAAFVFAAVTLIICFASFIGIRRVARIEPAIVFRS